MNHHDELEAGLNNYPLDDKADSSDSLVNSVDIEAASQDSLKVENTFNRMIYKS